MARSRRAPAGLFHRALSQRAMEALLHAGGVFGPHARRGESRQGLGQSGRPGFVRADPGRANAATGLPACRQVSLGGIMRTARLAAAAAILAAIAAPAAAQDVKRGETLLARECGRCHAVGRTGDSAAKDAPAFRTLAKRYPIESLEEALGE